MLSSQNETFQLIKSWKALNVQSEIRLHLSSHTQFRLPTSNSQLLYKNFFGTDLNRNLETSTPIHFNT